MLTKLIRRMINNGYSDEEITLRLRCKPGLVNAIRVQIEIESNRLRIREGPYDE